ncbi:MAG: glycosyltransferase family 2 protein [candidate division Zixibacteria bacterium]|nr:glycosyltransferase family 2 protein [candidate division Zixibacteria bacterium]
MSDREYADSENKGKEFSSMSSSMSDQPDAGVMLPVVSIALPVFNGVPFIGEAIESILSQSFKDFELIITDNASTDGTDAVCLAYAEKDSRVRYSRNEQNIGSVNNYICAFEKVRGKYFKFATANDVCAPELLERCIEVLESQPDVVLVYGRTKLMDEQGIIFQEYDDRLDLRDSSSSERFIKFMLNVRLANALAGLIRIDQLRQTRFLGNHIASDITLMGELALRGKYFELPEFLFFRRVGKQSSTLNKSLEELKKFYDPLSKKRIALIYWRLNWEHFHSVARVSMDSKEKLKLFFFLTKHVFWDRQKLATELLTVLKQM